MDYRVKEEDARKAEKIAKVAEKNIDIALTLLSTIRDREAKIQALTTLYNITDDESYLRDACELAETEEDILRIIERSKQHNKILDEIAARMQEGYRKDVAFSILLEKTGDLNYASKIRDVRLLSASLKRLSLKKRYPENLSIARMIPEAYYRCLALLKIAEKEGVDLKREILNSAENIRLHYLRMKVISAANSLQI